MRNAGLAKTVFNGIDSNYRSDSEKAYVLQITRQTFAIYQIIDEMSTDNGIIVLDEGLCQRCLSIYLYGNSESTKEIALYVDQIPSPDVLFHIDAEPSTCNQRLASRGYIERLDHSVSRMQILQNCRFGATTICEKLASRNVRVCEVSNDGTFDSSVQLIQECLDKFLKHDAAD